MRPIHYLGHLNGCGDGSTICKAMQVEDDGLLRQKYQSEGYYIYDSDDEEREII
jgi:hypothetical protein